MKVFAVILVTVALAQAADLRPRFDTSVKPKHPFDSVDLSAAQTGERIVGGSEAVRNSFPWQVALRIRGSSFCGGSLIHPHWVLTAAHCAVGGGPFEVILGAHEWNNVNEATQVRDTTSAATVHESYNSNNLHNDVALIRLSRDIAQTAAIQVVRLDATNTADAHDGEMATISGWGKTSDASSSVSLVLNEVTRPVITNNICDNTYGNVITTSSICVSTTGGQGTCNGDSGGPMVIFDANRNPTQVGVVSFVSSTGCQAGLPAGFARVSSFRQWIATNTGGEVPA